MTDRELDRLIALAESGEITEAQADRLDRETIRRAKARMTPTCEFAGCKEPARWDARKLWGKGGSIRTCNEHKPGGKRPESMKHLPSFYDVRPIGHDGETA